MKAFTILTELFPFIQASQTLKKQHLLHVPACTYRVSLSYEYITITLYSIHPQTMSEHIFTRIIFEWRADKITVKETSYAEPFSVNEMTLIIDDLINACAEKNTAPWLSAEIQNYLHIADRIAKKVCINMPAMITGRVTTAT